MSDRHTHRWVAAALRVYRLLLVCYPPSIRRRYGAEIVQVCRDMCRDVAHRKGDGAAARWWLRALGDLVAAACRERMGTMRDRWLLLCVPLAVALGVAIAYIDARPHWDDTGISAAALLATSGALGLARPRHPWLWALAVGLWIPAANIAFHRNYGALLALVIAFAGAYAGAFLRRALIGSHKTA